MNLITLWRRRRKKKSTAYTTEVPQYDVRAATKRDSATYTTHSVLAGAVVVGSERSGGDMGGG